ncbi:hypothetical protein [Nocardia sp. NPDC004860]|uniref:hypothetical protein n=1 Tax=unclassified Nocardia TaxID=2637762 RepID=UPI0033A8DCF9
MRSTPISSLVRGQILRCYDCGLLCKPAALRPGDDSCPRCHAHPLVIISTSGRYGSECSPPQPTRNDV